MSKPHKIYIMTFASIRLKDAEIESIQQAFLYYFGPDDQLWIFGSRINPEARGGDIDLYVEIFYPDAALVFDQKIKFLRTLKFGGILQKSKGQEAVLKGIGDRKIDVVINMGGDQLPYIKLREKKGFNSYE